MNVKEMTEESLKARGFELINMINLAQNDLTVIQQELNFREKEKKGLTSLK